MKSLQRLLVLISFFLIADVAVAQTYRITIRNRTPQLLTSAVCAVHRRNTEIFTMGTTASEGLAVLAEDGVAGTFRQELRATDGILETATGPFISPRKRGNLRIGSKRRGRVSCVLGMLVSTNDGFPAFLNRRLPKRVGQVVRFRAKAYDAGSEVNTESCDDVPGPPCDAHFVGVKENGTIQEHPGVLGISDVSPDRYGWSGPAATGTIRRIR